MVQSETAVTTAPAGASELYMDSAMDQLPIPLMIGVMVLGVVLVLIAVAPTAVVDRFHKAWLRRYGQPRQ